MKGIQFLVDEVGTKKAVLIDLEEGGELWEDIHDIMVTEERKNEPTVSWESVKERLEGCP